MFNFFQLNRNMSFVNCLFVLFFQLKQQLTLSQIKQWLPKELFNVQQLLCLRKEINQKTYDLMIINTPIEISNISIYYENFSENKLSIPQELLDIFSKKFS